MTRAVSASPWYRDTAHAAGIPPAVAQRALEWLVELQGDDVPAEVRQAWTQWRAAHPDHERAWRRVEAVNGRLRPLSSVLNSAIAKAALLAPSMHQGHAEHPAGPAHPGPAAHSPPSGHRRRAIKALAVLGCTSGAAWITCEYAPWREWASDYRTAIGERRTLVLSDGSRVMLNTGSAIDVRFNAQERRIRLVSGEIFIATAPDPAPGKRPFLVESAEGTAQALGTEYTVRRLDGCTEVGVYKGAVRVRPRADSGGGLDVQAGYAATYTPQAIAVPRPIEENSIAWKDGFIVARGMRLDDFIAELGRYSTRALSCDPRIAALRVSGSFPLRDIEQVLRTVGMTVGARLEIQRRFWGRTAARLVPA